ncbi:hypothetical protein OEA41_006130 [Lepraria neglecta]|uniref:Amino acid transporter n=1 Tax=Lepraria neglecta TaxID=209136 RepID=A0AAD9Z750_9LECA|nr:hypothetical protein OEA41_006130 [Lepraria neglecta]
MNRGHELDTIVDNGMQKSRYHSEIEPVTKEKRDAQVLARLGKKSVLERRFGFISILGFTCTILVTWEGSLILFTTGLTNGGSAGLVYGYLLVWIGTIAVYTTMAELASMAPTAGGQYHWVSMLAPPSIRNFMSYIMGWLVICGWQAILAGGGYLAGTMIEALIQLNHANYVPQLWHGTLLFWATIVVAVFINTVTSGVLPKIEAFILVVHVVGFFAVLIPIVYLAPNKASAHDVFTQFSNGGAWPTQGLSFFIGLVGNVFAMFGCDSAVHMAEEIKNAEIVVPWSMLTTTVLNGALGFGIVIAVLFVTTDITAALSSPTGLLGYPFMQIFYDATGSKAGASVMIAIIIMMDAAATIAFLATASRLVWAFARDRGLPGWRIVSKLQPKTAIPMLAVIITSSIACLIGLINIGSATAFNDVISLGVSSLYASYVITESFLLWRRCTGGIRMPTDISNDTGEANQLVWGPFHLPGIFGILVNAFAVAFGIIIFFFSFWPVATPVQAAHMNFSVLMTGSVVLFAIFYYVVWARKTYKGPIVEVTPYTMNNPLVVGSAM